MFVYYLHPDAGSVQNLVAYVKAGRKLGHEVMVYGIPDPRISLPLTLDVSRVDGLVFIFEWTQQLKRGDQLDLARMLAAVPRQRRVVIDCDGQYNQLIKLAADQNHPDEVSAQRWRTVAQSITDKIFQTPVSPKCPEVRSFNFHAYDPSWERPLQRAHRPFDLVYVGHSKYRWRPMLRVLKAIEPIRHRIGRIAVVGHGWNEPPSWAAEMGIESSYEVDPEILRRLEVEVYDPVPYPQVLDWMSNANINPVLTRPLFMHLGLSTPRLFETFSSGSLPLLVLDRDFIRHLYGEVAFSLTLPNERPQDLLVDMLSRPERYRKVVRQLREHLRRYHTHVHRLTELVEIVRE